MSIVLIWVGLIFKIFPSKFSLWVAGVSVAEFITVRFQPSTLTPSFADVTRVSVAEFITVRFQPASDFIVKSMMLLPGK